MDAKKLTLLENYYENMPYGNKSLASEVHGPHNQAIINESIKTLVQMSDVAQESGDQPLAESLKGGIHFIKKQLDNLKRIKEEHSSDLRTRSNWTDHGWDDNVFTEQCKFSFDDKMNILITAYDPTSNQEVTKKIDEITLDWVSIGDWMQTLSQAKQELIEARNDMGTPPPFDIDFFTNNLLQGSTDDWKSILSDQDSTMDPNGAYKGFRLQQILHQDADENGNLPIDYNIDKFSFDPSVDNRLHSAIANDLKRAFDPNYQTESEIAEAQQLMNRISS